MEVKCKTFSLGRNFAAFQLIFFLNLIYKFQAVLIAHRDPSYVIQTQRFGVIQVVTKLKNFW